MSCELLRKVVQEVGGSYYEDEKYCIAYLDKPVNVDLDIYYRPNKKYISKIHLRRIGNIVERRSVGTAYLEDVEGTEAGKYMLREEREIYRVTGKARRVVMLKEKGEVLFIL